MGHGTRLCQEKDKGRKEIGREEWGGNGQEQKEEEEEEKEEENGIKDTVEKRLFRRRKETRGGEWRTRDGQWCGELKEIVVI